MSDKKIYNADGVFYKNTYINDVQNPQQDTLTMVCHSHFSRHTYQKLHTLTDDRTIRRCLYSSSDLQHYFADRYIIRNLSVPHELTVHGHAGEIEDTFELSLVFKKGNYHRNINLVSVCVSPQSIVPTFLRDTIDKSITSPDLRQRAIDFIYEYLNISPPYHQLVQFYQSPNLQINL